MVAKSHSHRTSTAIAELQTALDMQDAAEKLVALKLARLATLLSATSARSGGHKPGPVLVVNNAVLPRQTPLSDNAA